MSIDVEFLAQAFKQSPMPAMIVLPDDPIFTIVEHICGQQGPVSTIWQDKALRRHFPKVRSIR